MNPSDQMSSSAGAHIKTGDGCLSDLTLDEIVAGTLTRAAHENHLVGCARCRTRLQSFEDSSQIAAAAVGAIVAGAASRSAKTVEEGGFWRRLAAPRVVLATTAAMACAALLVLVDGQDRAARPESGTDDIRVKGTSLRFFVQRAGQVMPGESGGRYQAGDALRFVVSNGTPSFFFLVGIEESGKVSAYYPFAGDRSVRLAAGVDLPLAGSLVLDEAPGGEVFLGLFSPEPLTFDAVVRAIREAQGTGPAWPESLRSIGLPGQHHWLVIHKK